jgi:aerobic carbon-monoxide dehydrogenase medium subunit
VKPPPFAYHAPRDLDEALDTLAGLGDDGKVLAGGQSLVPMLNMRLVAPRALVDIGRVSELDTLEVADGQVRVGALARHARVHRDPQVRRCQPLLHEALGWVAHPVIRNRGTAVGSLVHADPAAELPAVLALLDGRVELAGADGRRHVAAADFFRGPLESDTRSGELAVAATFPVAPPGTGTAVVELSRRHGDYALAGVAVTVGLDGDRRVAQARSAFLGVGGVPVVVDLTGTLAGQPADALQLDESVAHARGAIDPDDDIHATAAYRRHLAGVLLARALRDAATRAADRDATAGPAGEERA